MRSLSRAVAGRASKIKQTDRGGDALLWRQQMQRRTEEMRPVSSSLIDYAGLGGD